MSATQKPAKRSGAFTDEERAAMKERARELKAAAAGADGERELLAKIPQAGPIASLNASV